MAVGIQLEKGLSSVGIWFVWAISVFITAEFVEAWWGWSNYLEIESIRCFLHQGFLYEGGKWSFSLLQCLVWSSFWWYWEEEVDYISLCHYMDLRSIRNKMVFENHKPDWELEKRQIKVRWAYWLKSWLANKDIMVEDLSANPSALNKWRWLIKGAWSRCRIWYL